MNQFLLSRPQMLGLVAAVTLAVFAAVAFLREAGVLQSAEFAQYDLTMTALATPTDAPDIVLVTVSDGELADWGWPLSDGKLAEIIDAALAAGAAVVGIDIFRDISIGDGRAELSPMLSHPQVISINRLGPDGQPAINAPAEARAGARFGFSDIPLDFDGVARRSLLLVSSEAGVALSFPMKLAMTFLGQTALAAWPDDPSVLLFGQTPVPALSKGFGAYRGVDAAGYQVPIEFTRRLPGARRISALTLVTDGDTDALLDGRIALIGITSHSVKDYFVTPLNRSTGADFAFGVELHAAALQQLIDHTTGARAPLQSPGRLAGLAILLAAALGGAVSAVLARRAAPALVAGPGLAAVVLLTLSGFLAAGWILPAVPAALAWFLASIACGTLISVTARSQRKAMVGLFTAHLSPELAQEIWQQRHSILAGQKPIPQRLFVTALMGDIAGSTKTGRSMEPAAFMEWISLVLDELGGIARDHGGFVEKFTGDGILVAFGAPLPSDSAEARTRDARAAAACARDMAQAVARLNAGQPAAPYGLRIGLNSGEVLGGTLGQSGAMQYNIIGDTVNIAARVEAWGKRLQGGKSGATSVCLTDQTAALLGASFAVTRVGKMTHDDGSHVFEIFELDTGTEA